MEVVSAPTGSCHLPSTGRRSTEAWPVSSALSRTRVDNLPERWVRCSSFQAPGPCTAMEATRRISMMRRWPLPTTSAPMGATSGPKQDAMRRRFLTTTPTGTPQMSWQSTPTTSQKSRASRGPRRRHLAPIPRQTQRSDRARVRSLRPRWRHRRGAARRRDRRSLPRRQRHPHLRRPHLRRRQQLVRLRHRPAPIRRYRALLPRARQVRLLARVPLSHPLRPHRARLQGRQVLRHRYRSQRHSRYGGAIAHRAGLDAGVLTVGAVNVKGHAA
ncbi:hypothetical protein CLV47_10660 [Antricoccus suffuscus]|uniref:Uncharacterized protein n=1 Tax=Antricoccus suffuscus TaxID=1629062 RepID=A0A2T1A0Q9_9ACTN|nr:hypothetical protein CLV47_10660 [Antricoccus suffuscus]